MTDREFIEMLCSKWGCSNKVAPFEREKAARLLRDHIAAQLRVERTAETESENDVNPYILTGDELAQAETAARSR